VKHHSPKFLAIVNDAKSRIRETGIEEVRKRLERGDAFHLVDVREESEWNEGHLPNAVHLCKGIIERDVETKFPDPDAEIVLYCGGGYRSVLAGRQPAENGLHQRDFDGRRFRAWFEAGYPVKKG